MVSQYCPASCSTAGQWRVSLGPRRCCCDAALVLCVFRAVVVPMSHDSSIAAGGVHAPSLSPLVPHCGCASADCPCAGPVTRRFRIAGAKPTEIYILDDGFIEARVKERGKAEPVTIAKLTQRGPPGGRRRLVCRPIALDVVLGVCLRAGMFAQINATSHWRGDQCAGPRHAQGVGTHGTIKPAGSSTGLDATGAVVLPWWAVGLDFHSEPPTRRTSCPMISGQYFSESAILSGEPSIATLRCVGVPVPHRIPMCLGVTLRLYCAQAVHSRGPKLPIFF